MIPENERARRGKAPPIQNERPRGAAGILGEEEQQRATRPTRSPRLRTICRVVVYARRNPARMNRRIISEFGRIAPKCSLICGKERGGFPKRRALYEFAPLLLRGIFARTTRRQPSARSAGTRTSGSSEQAFSHPRDDLAPRFSALGPRTRAPAKGGATMSRKPRYASFAPALGPGEQVKSSSTCTSTPPFAVIGAPIAAKQPSTHAFNSSNCSPSLM